MTDAYLSVDEPISRSRYSSNASISELVGHEEDKSFERTGDVVRLSKCDDEKFIANAYRYCRRCLRGNWAKCPTEKFSVSYVSGGLTNYLYLCSLPNDVELLKNEPRKVLIRIYGEIIDRKQRYNEGVIFTLLSERGFGPKTYGVFYSGRIEEFVPHRHLYTRELAIEEISHKIAEKTGSYHCMNLPLNKEPVFLWENFEKFISMCRDLKFNDEESQKFYESIKEEINFDEEYEWLRMMLLQLNNEVVFCHNDLQEGNLLYIKEKDNTDILIIDYDYSCYNYRSYDLGNHFCEWMYEYKDDIEDGFKVYYDGYPTHDQQMIFATTYLNSISKIKEQCLEDVDSSQKLNVSWEMCTVEELLYDANRFALASHLFWALWSIVQGQVSKIDFNFMKYAKARLDTYQKQKKELGL